ncbi:hypothetical protein CCAN2_1890001 [Capnocytophaga canimorsus]|uniref:Uncharacterized protein n=1 Tax=Capnocytophaga canimorsus TaxID=28188 RepID=A0A0B7ICW3_9FLAO|nr:hypothetical protein CCAN11_1530002 [Capnocytophaga canimorsus]CEN48218.1 hypothetical protein CCAN2_1890001 [Capnocytophaga canimorsus]
MAVSLFFAVIDFIVKSIYVRLNLVFNNKKSR